MIMEIKTSFKKSFDSSFTIPETLAPKTLRTPISLRRCSAVYAAKPKSPKQDISMANKAKI